MNCSFEEGLAGLAGGDPVVKAGRHVAADETHPLGTVLIFYRVLEKRKILKKIVLAFFLRTSERQRLESYGGGITRSGSAVVVTQVIERRHSVRASWVRILVRTCAIFNSDLLPIYSR